MDSVGAGEGEIVFYVSGSSARYTDVTEGKPSDSAVIAIVDLIEVNGRIYLSEKRITHDPCKSCRHCCFARHEMTAMVGAVTSW